MRCDVLRVTPISRSTVGVVLLFVLMVVPVRGIAGRRVLRVSRIWMSMGVVDRLRVRMAEGWMVLAGPVLIPLIRGVTVRAGPR